MIATEAVRKARKKAQMDRLKAKTKDDYPAYYANMPQQLVKAKANEQIRNDKAEVRATQEALQIAEITGKNLLAAQEKATVAILVLEKHEAAERPNPSIILTGG